MASSARASHPWRYRETRRAGCGRHVNLPRGRAVHGIGETISRLSKGTNSTFAPAKVLSAQCLSLSKFANGLMISTCCTFISITIRSPYFPVSRHHSSPSVICSSGSYREQHLSRLTAVARDEIRVPYRYNASHFAQRAAGRARYLLTSGGSRSWDRRGARPD